VNGTNSGENENDGNRNTDLAVRSKIGILESLGYPESELNEYLLRNNNNDVEVCRRWLQKHIKPETKSKSETENSIHRNNNNKFSKI